MNRLLCADGQAFQILFSTVMSASHADFVTIRPQGSKGDGGNDGFVPSAGHYFQVYGPIDPSSKITYAVKKLARDFSKLQTTWAESVPIQAFSFVFNDKYQGALDFTRFDGHLT